MLLAIVQRVLQLVHPLTGHIKVPRRQRVGKSKIEQQVYQYAPRVNVFLLLAVNQLVVFYPGPALYYFYHLSKNFFHFFSFY